MKRTLAVAAALVLTVLVAGCDDSGDPQADPSGSPDASGSSSGGAGEVENETYPRGADVAGFCEVLAEIDSAIDEAGDGPEDWDRILAAFEALDALGVPDDLPESAVSELVHVELLVQQSTSVAEFNDAVEQSPPTSGTVDAYIDDHC